LWASNRPASSDSRWPFRRDASASPPCALAARGRSDDRPSYRLGSVTRAATLIVRAPRRRRPPWWRMRVPPQLLRADRKRRSTWSLPTARDAATIMHSLSPSARTWRSATLTPCPSGGGAPVIVARRPPSTNAPNASRRPPLAAAPADQEAPPLPRTPRCRRLSGSPADHPAIRTSARLWAWPPRLA
jgi:hypothetical protein